MSLPAIHHGDVLETGRKLMDKMVDLLNAFINNIP